MRLFCIFSVILLHNVVFGARILCIYPTPSISHQIVYRALTQELARRGHQLVVITTDPYLPKDRPADNVREIDVHDTYHFITRAVSIVASRRWSPAVMDFHNIILKACLEAFDAQLDFPEVKELIGNKSEHFDLLIVESVNRPTYFFTHRFKAPVIGLSSLMGLQFNYDAMGTPSNPILYPDIFQKKFGNLTIWDQVEAVFTDWYQRYAYWSSAEEENIVGKKHFGVDTPDIQQLANNNDLLFLNVHPVWEGIRPTPPSVIYVGGLHIQSPKELPKDLKSYLDGCTQGVVYMSLGSNIQSSELPADKRSIFLEVFADLPYCVLWKWETEDLPEKPDNVRISKWLPQSDLLSHPNILAFITQGGLQSTDEAIDREVPMIGVPFLGDQEKNVQKCVYHGIGVALHIGNIDSASLKNAILTVIRDDSYRKNIHRLKSLMYDQPSSALDRAAWWVEYLLRHGNARHLRSPLADQKTSYWMFMSWILIIISVFTHALYIARIVYRMTVFKSKKIKTA